MIIELTDKFLKSLTLAKANAMILKDGGKPQARRADIGDGIVKGLTIRITNNADRKVWTLSYISPVTGKSKREKLGVYGAEEHGGVTLAIARTKAVGLKTGVYNKIDPQIARQAETPAMAIAKLIEKRLAMEIRSMQRRTEEVKYIIQIIGDVAIQAFKVAPHSTAVIDPIMLRGKIRMPGSGCTVVIIGASS